MAGSPPLRSSSFVGGFVKSERAVTDAIRSAKSSDFESRRLVVPKARGLLSKDERKAAQSAVQIRRVSFVRVQNKQTKQTRPNGLSFCLSHSSDFQGLTTSRGDGLRTRRKAPARCRYMHGCTAPRAPGDVAQLGEHLLCKQGVSGSSPLISTSTLTTE